MNKRGFTLVELLVTIVILGLISYIGFPSLMRVITNTNSKKEFEYYGDMMISAAKLYIRKEATDLQEANSFSSDGYNVKLSDLINDEYISRPTFTKKTMSCDESDANSYVNVKYISSSNTYIFSYNLICQDTSIKKKYTKSYKKEEFIVSDLN